ncbi:MAG: DUF444 family protein [Sandaracinaceae bacterium]|nr:DUF444 family protein [Sandaracinaceae bacterium]MDW8245820.1 DUF444 family protein [Sandaracinaceae bacterium]
MSLRIDLDHSRFRQIIRGKIRQNLRKFITRGEILGKQGKDVVSIPLPHIEIPRLRHSERQVGGVGQGEGKEGEPIGGDGQKGEGQGRAGQEEGSHVLEAEVTLDELADILGEELALPRIVNKGKSKIVDLKERYTGIRRVGPSSLRHFKRTFKQALKRELAMGTYNPKRPIVVPTPEDFRFRSWNIEEEPIANAVIIYMMDVSGSMGDEQKEIVRIESFWIDTWIRRHYKGLETRYIIHDATAREVDRDTFFRTRESGGTMISSAYKLCHQIIEADYPASDWNIYLFHFSDGDNWSLDDTMQCIDILKNKLLPVSNLFGYGQVESPYGSGQFIKDLREHLGKDERVVTSEIRNRDGIIPSIQAFLGKGR